MGAFVTRGVQSASNGPRKAGNIFICNARSSTPSPRFTASGSQNKFDKGSPQNRSLTWDRTGAEDLVHVLNFQQLGSCLTLRGLEVHSCLVTLDGQGMLFTAFLVQLTRTVRLFSSKETLAMAPRGVYQCFQFAQQILVEIMMSLPSGSKLLICHRFV